MYYISFPGLGIEPFHIDKVAFTLFGRDVAWYGILITVGMLLAVVCALRLVKFEGISSDDICDLALVVIICGVICARAYYVIFSWNEFNYLVTDKGFFGNIIGTFVNCIAVWNGGLAIYGGVLGGLASAYVFSRVKKIDFLKIADILVPSVLIGQVIGRWGNFINIEAYGGATELPWRMGILYGNAELGIFTLEKYVHPTFLYESLWNLLLLTVVLVFYKKKKFTGQWFASYLVWYGFGRMLIEGLRTDSLMLGSIRISQLIGLCSCIIGAVLMIIWIRKSKKTISSAETEEYKNVFDKSETDEQKEEN